MVKKTTWLLSMVFGIVVGANSAQATQIQAAPVELQHTISVGKGAPAMGGTMRRSTQ